MRRDQANKREEFDYDGLYRLSQVRLYATVGGSTAAQTDNHTFDAIGNLTNKGGASGSYTYGGYNYGTRTGCSNTVIRPHAVYQVNAAGTTRRYCYDGNGNLAAVSKTSGTGPIIYDATTWWVANLAKRISQGGTAAYSDFWYGPGRERIQQIAKKSASVTETTLYVGGAYEKVTRGATVEHVHYIRGGGDVAAIQKKTAGAGTETRYLHRDHLGSVVAATDATGAVLERYSFDPWGKRRDPGTWINPAVGTFSHDPAFNDRGYTGHEHIDHLGLVNMNGRVYDPEIGRFLSADPFVQFPESTQGYNRYTYVGNNPLSYSDPSGFFSFKKFFQILGIVMSIFIPTGINLLWEKILWGFASGFAASGGDLKAGTLGALGGALFHGIGKWAALDDIARTLVHGITSGVLAELGDGTFKSGFFGGFFGSLGGLAGFKMFGAPVKGDTIGAIKRTIVAALAGGVGSAAGGGKFKNGAITAAMAHMFNHEASALGEENKARPADRYKQLSREFRDSISEAHEMGAEGNIEGYLDKVRSGGDWDYKSRPEYKELPTIEDFGNFAFGATSAAWADGFTGGVSSLYPDVTINLILRGAGAYQEYFQGYTPRNGHWYDLAPPALSNYGDQFRDSLNILWGAQYYYRKSWK